MAGGPISSLPKHVLAGLAKSLAVYSGMPEEIAWGHIKARGGTPPPLDGKGAKMRGALLKVLAEEVLDENGNGDGGKSALRDDGTGFEPELSKPSKKPVKRKNSTKKDEPEAKPSSSTETQLTRAVGVKDGNDGSDSDSDEVASKPKPAPPARDETGEEESDEESESDDGDDDDDSENSDDAPEEEEEHGAFWFGKAATEAPPPPGANPFAAADADNDLQKEAADQIAEAKKIVAERRALASAAAAALASEVRNIEIRPGNVGNTATASHPHRAVAFTKEAVDIAGAAEEREISRRSTGLGGASASVGEEKPTTNTGASSECAPSELDGDERDKRDDCVSVAGSDFPGSDAGTSAAGGSVAGSVAATHGSEEPPRVDDLVSVLGDYDDTASIATSRGALLEEDEDAETLSDSDGSGVVSHGDSHGESGSEDDGDDDDDDAESESDSDDDKENDPEPRAARRTVLRARRPPRNAPGPAVSLGETTPVVVAVAVAEEETRTSDQEKE